MSFSQILHEDANHKLSEAETSYLNRLTGAGKYMAELIDDILDLARISRVELKLEKVNITHIASSIASRLQQTDNKRK